MGLLLLTACHEDRREVNTPAVLPPTRTLIPPSPTPTVEAGLVTPTPTDLPWPSTLIPAASDVEAFALPPSVQAVIDLTMTDLKTQPDIRPEDIRLVSIDAFIWSDPSWGCQTRPANSGGQGVVGGYRIVFSAGNHLYVYHTDTYRTFFLCSDAGWMASEGRPVATDPIAQSMADLVRQDAARRLGKTENEIDVTSLALVVWPDTSLGCPKPGADYEDTPTTGYRVVLRADDDMLIYHTSTRDVMLCTSEEEILPGLIQQALATPVPQ
jgi:hypothetical protein